MSTCRQHSFLYEQQNVNFRYFYISDKYKFVYCHTPKVACTSWKIAMTGLYFRRASFRIYANKINQNASNFVQLGHYFHPHEVYQRLHTYYKFMFVREPLERLLSAYRMFFMKGDKRLAWHKTEVRKRLKSKAKGNLDHGLHGSTSCCTVTAKSYVLRIYLLIYVFLSWVSESGGWPCFHISHSCLS